VGLRKLGFGDEEEKIGAPQNPNRSSDVKHSAGEELSFRVESYHRKTVREKILVRPSSVSRMEESDVGQELEAVSGGNRVLRRRN
jgi:hypothetical protein